MRSQLLIIHSSEGPWQALGCTGAGLPLYVNNGFSYILARLKGMGIQSIAHGVSNARMRVYEHLCKQFYEFVFDAETSELRAARKLIRLNFDATQSPKVYHTIQLSSNRAAARVKLNEAARSDISIMDVRTFHNNLPISLHQDFSPADIS